MSVIFLQKLTVLTIRSYEHFLRNIRRYEHRQRSLDIQSGYTER